jgi:hypothetical protein
MNITTIPHSRAESWLQRVGIIVAKSWDRTLVALLCTRTKTRRLSFFLSILTFAYLLGIVFDLFVPFGRTVETQRFATLVLAFARRVAHFRHLPLKSGPVV